MCDLNDLKLANFKSPRFQEELNDLTNNVVFIRAYIYDIQFEVDSMLQDIKDDSWMNNLDSFDKMVYEATSQRTIEAISNKILNDTSDTELLTSVGEYIVSLTGQNALVEICQHVKIPLAEILKEKVTGNSGFDFHTLSKDGVLVFGEAKFSLKDTRHSDAINQIAEFVELGKDNAELQAIKPFLNRNVQKNLINGLKEYSAAFSVNEKDEDSIFNKVLKLRNYNNLAQEYKLYIITVQYVKQ